MKGLFWPSPSSAVFPGAVANAINVPVAASIAPRPRKPMAREFARSLLLNGLSRQEFQEQQRHGRAPGNSVQDAIEVDGLVAQVTIGLNVGGGGHQQILAAYLDGVAGVVKNTCFRAFRLASEVADRSLHGVPVWIDHQIDREAETTQGRADAVGVVRSIGERRHVFIFGNADDERNLAALCQNSAVEHQEEHEKANECSHQEGHRNRHHPPSLNSARTRRNRQNAPAPWLRKVQLWHFSEVPRHADDVP